MRTTRKLPTPTLESDMQALIETIAGGLMLGALYALFGLGLSLSLGVMKNKKGLPSEALPFSGS